MGKLELPEGMWLDVDTYISECPQCLAEQADMGSNVQCEECGYGPMPTLPAEWPHCAECGQALDPEGHCPDGCNTQVNTPV